MIIKNTVIYKIILLLIYIFIMDADKKKKLEKFEKVIF